MSDDILRQLSQLGKGLMQINLKLGKLGDLVEQGAGGRDTGPDELLLDLLEAVEQTLEQPPPQLPAAPPRWLFWRRPAAPAPLDLRGLRLARDHVLDKLAARGIRVIATSGAVDPALHRVIDVRPTPDASLDRTIAATHQRGWVRAPDQVIRFAHVTAWRHDSPHES